MMAASERYSDWLDRHPFLVRDFRRMRRKGRLWRTLLIPPLLTAILAAAIHYGAALTGHSPLLPMVDYALLALVLLVQAGVALLSVDPLGGWAQEDDAQRIEALRLTPLTAGQLAVAATERRFYLRLMMALAFLPVILWIGVLARVSATTLLGVYTLIGLFAWSTTPASLTELVFVGAAKIGGSSRQKQVVQMRGWSAVFLLIFYVPLLTCVFFADFARHHQLDFLTPTLGRDVTPHFLFFPMSVPLMAAHYVTHARPFFHLAIVPLLWIAAVALLSREIRILTACRWIRSERVPIPSKLTGQTMTALAPPVDRKREDRPIRRLQIVRGLILRVALIGAIWPLIESLGSFVPDRLMIAFVGLGALVGVVRSLSGSRSLLLPGRLETFFQREMPEAVKLGRVDSRGPLAAAVVAEAVGWELLALTLVCVLGGICPNLSGSGALNILALVAAAFLLAESGAVGSALSSLPAAAKRQRGTAIWNSGAAAPLARLKGGVGAAFVLAFLTIPAAGFFYVTAPQWLPACAVNPIIAWLLLLVNPGRSGLAVLVLAPGLLAAAIAAGLILADRRSGRAPSQLHEAVRPAPKKAPQPLPWWIHRPLASWVDRAQSPFLYLEFNRIQRKSGEVKAQLFALGIVVATLGFGLSRVLIGAVDTNSSPTDATSLLTQWSLASLLSPVHVSTFQIPLLGALSLLVGLTLLFIAPLLMLASAAGIFSREWKANRSGGGLSFLLMTPLSPREMLGGMAAGKTLQNATSGFAGLFAGAILILIPLAFGAPALALLAAAAVLIAGLVIGAYIMGATLATAGPERWRPWVVGIFSGTPVLLFIGSLLGMMSLHLGPPWLTCSLLYFEVAAILAAGAYGWYRLGAHGIRRFRETDAAGVSE